MHVYALIAYETMALFQLDNNTIFIFPLAADTAELVAEHMPMQRDSVCPQFT